MIHVPWTPRYGGVALVEYHHDRRDVQPERAARAGVLAKELAAMHGLEPFAQAAAYLVPILAVLLFVGFIGVLDGVE